MALEAITFQNLGACQEGKSGRFPGLLRKKNNQEDSNCDLPKGLYLKGSVNRSEGFKILWDSFRQITLIWAPKGITPSMK